MGSTPLRNIFFQTLGLKWNPVTESANQANSIEEALKYAPLAVASTADRALKFPTPYQGAAVYRLDNGDTERYFAAYNAQTNPGGRTPAGWYSENVKVRTASFTATGSTAANQVIGTLNNLTPVAAKTVNNDFVTVPSNGRLRLRSGLYALSVTIRLKVPATGRTFLEVADLNDTITRVSIGVGEDITTLVNGNIYVVDVSELIIRYYKNADTAGGLPNINLDITKIG